MKKLTTQLILTAVAATLLAGCGSKVNQVAVSADAGDSTAMSVAAPAAPSTGITPVANQLTAASTAAPPLTDITATVTAKKNGKLFGMGKFTCTVEVTNPSSVPRHGVLTVTFLNGKKDSKTAPETRPVTLLANETRSYSFVDPKWSTDSVKAEFVTAPDASAPAATSTGMAAASVPAPAGTASAPSTTGLPTTTY